MSQEPFKCRGDYQKQHRDAKCHWKAPGKKSEEWMFPRRKNQCQCQWQKTTREGCPLVRGTSVREKDFTS